MDQHSSASPTRKELQGPRPTPLKVRKESHKIKKPQRQQQQSSQQQQLPIAQDDHQYRPPIIIYTVSPKVIHTNPNEFMTLVQRLTGSSSSSSSSYAYYSNNNNISNSDHNNTSTTTSYRDGTVSPAARYATTEKAAKSPLGNNREFCGYDRLVVDDHDDVVDAGRRSSNLFQGILSPGPASLPRTDYLFSPINSLGSFFNDLSPYQHQHQHFAPSDKKTYIDTTFLNSPSPRFFSPIANIVSSSNYSPVQSMDLFNHFFNY